MKCTITRPGLVLSGAIALSAAALGIAQGDNSNIPMQTDQPNYVQIVPGVQASNQDITATTISGRLLKQQKPSMQSLVIKPYSVPTQPKLGNRNFPYVSGNFLIFHNAAPPKDTNVIEGPYMLSAAKVYDSHTSRPVK